jgi:hypothetical protein
VLPLGAANVPRMRHLTQKPRDLPIDLGDAALVSVAEGVRIDAVVTRHRRDFDVCRRGQRSSIPTRQGGEVR